MSNRIAIILGFILVAAYLADRTLFDGQGLIAIGRGLIDIIHWLRFWN